LNYLVTIQGHGDALISYMIAKNIKNEELVIICNNQSLSLLKYYISGEKIISDEFSSLYNIRKDGILKAIKSWIILVKYLRKISKKDKIYFEKNDFRFIITKYFVHYNSFAPDDQSFCIYKKRQMLFGTDFPFTYLINAEQLRLDNKKVIIFPGSRIKAKEISTNSIQQLFNVLKMYKTNIELHYFIHDDIPSIYLKQTYTKKFDTIENMIKAIESADIIISADSLPLHVTYFLNKPVIPFYNIKVNSDWLPIGVSDFLILNNNNKNIFSENLSRIWSKN
jgi:ADP-heptose:LPS heptosyltransferase